VGPAGSDTWGGRTDRLLRPKEVAERLGVSQSMVYKLVSAGALRAVYVGRLPRISVEDLALFVEQGRRGRGS
jgi:excisionase family DNA binding protein